MRQQFKVASKEERGSPTQHNPQGADDLEESQVAQEEEEGKVQEARCLPSESIWVHKTAARKEAVSGWQWSTCFSKAEVDHYLKEIYNDECRKQDLGPSKALIKPPVPVL